MSTLPFTCSKPAQKEGVSIYAMLYAVCWLWLQERTPEEVKGERGQDFWKVK